MRDMFDEIDKNRDDLLSHGELKRYLKGDGLACSIFSNGIRAARDVLITQAWSHAVFSNPYPTSQASSGLNSGSRRVI